MEENEKKQQFRCPNDCTKCLRVQREYCSAQKALENQRILISMQDTIKSMSGTIEELRDKINAIQDNEAMVFDHNAETTETDIAQEGGGAEE